MYKLLFCAVFELSVLNVIVFRCFCVIVTSVLLLPVFRKYLKSNRCLCIENEFWYVNEFDVCDGFICPCKSHRQRQCSVAYESCQ